jgi:oligopeptide/dipeptide ABC transporter ATP-binding protein
VGPATEHHEGRLRADLPPAALEVRDLHTSFSLGDRRIEVVRGVDLDLHTGRTLVVLGESGSGKSVTARSILRIAPGARIDGRLLMDDVDLATLPDARMRKLLGARIGFVPQDPAGALSPLRTVGSQIREVLRWHKVVSSRRAATDRAVELLARVGIADPKRVVRAHAHELSGGMRQRVAIAIAIACEPSVVVADEPTTALDVTVQAQVLDLFDELRARLGMALMLVTHDVGVAERVADEIAVMYAGRVVERGPAEVLLSNPAHPYTRALLRAVPRPGAARGTLEQIPGQPVAPGALPGGCPFAPRCPFVQDRCRLEEPPLRRLGERRAAACLRAEHVLQLEEGK